MKYPRLPRHLDRRYKTTKEDVKDIKYLRKNGYKLWEIAEEFNLSVPGVQCILRSKAEKQRLNKITGGRHVQKYKTDAKYRKKARENNIKSHDYILSVNPKLREYQRKQNLKRSRLKKSKKK